MLESQLDYVPLLVAGGLVCGLGAAMIFLNWILGPKRKTAIKQAAFECGSEPITDARHRFGVKFYLIAIFFIVFDIEAVFMYPWAVVYRDLVVKPLVGWLVFGEMFAFVAVLAMGLVYVWRRGALEWE